VSHVTAPDLWSACCRSCSSAAGYLEIRHIGGVLQLRWRSCADPDVARQMMSGRLKLPRNWRADFSSFGTPSLAGNWVARSDKIVLRLELRDIRRSLQALRLEASLAGKASRAEGVQCKSGTSELLDDFYTVFAENMRDLGTPVYPKRFFEAILRRYERHCQLVVITLRGQPVAAAFLCSGRSCRGSVGFLSGRRQALGHEHEALLECCRCRLPGAATYSTSAAHGRCGTDRFKRQWGAQPVQVYCTAGGVSPHETAAGEEREK